MQGLGGVAGGIGGLGGVAGGIGGSARSRSQGPIQV